MSFRHFTSVAALCAAAGTSTTALAQWIPNYQNYSVQRIGLYGPEQTSGTGLQSSTAQLFSGSSFVAGYSNRYIGADVDNGKSTWAWNGTTTIQVGLTGTGYTGNAGYQFSELLLRSTTGKLAGYSRRYSELNTSIGVDAWAWNGTTTTRIGLYGAGNIGTEGLRGSEPQMQNAAGLVAGYSYRFLGVSTNNGRDAWVWDGTTTRQIGLIGTGYTGSAGLRSSTLSLINAGGLIAGSSQRINGVDVVNGLNAWAWNGTTTTKIGLTGGVYTGSSGLEYSKPVLMNDAGHVIGTSNRIINNTTNYGQDTWAWNGTTTTQLGLTGPGYISSTGYQNSVPLRQNAAGQVVGASQRVSSLNTDNGWDAWTWDGSTTTRIGLSGAGYTSSTGFQSSSPLLQSASGKVAGYSSLITSAGTFNGYNAWVWNGANTIRIGLTGPANTGSAGYQLLSVALLNDAGWVTGSSFRITGERTFNGGESWIYNPTTNSTVQTGLTGLAYTGSAGYRQSIPNFLNAAGQAAGYSSRITGVDTENGQDAWYFDPTTQLSYPVTGSVRAADNYAYSIATILTKGGFLLGNYLFFPGGTGTGEQRAFIFRPDLGLTDLGNLVDGGLTLNGWATLQRPLFADALNTIVGYGYVNGQTTGQSVFVMVPTPSAAALLTLGGLLASRRRRR